jgi:hypothetical protein
LAILCKVGKNSLTGHKEKRKEKKRNKIHGSVLLARNIQNYYSRLKEEEKQINARKTKTNRYVSDI